MFFSSYNLPKTLPVTTLLLFGHVTLHYGTFLFILLGEGEGEFSCQTVNTIRPTRPCSTTAYPFTQALVRL